MIGAWEHCQKSGQLKGWKKEEEIDFENQRFDVQLRWRSTNFGAATARSEVTLTWETIASAIQETSVSRYHGGPIKSTSKPLRQSQHYRIKGALNCRPIM